MARTAPFLTGTDMETIKEAMAGAYKVFPSGYWQTYYRGGFRTADSKQTLRHYLSAIRKGEAE